MWQQYLLKVNYVIYSVGWNINIRDDLITKLVDKSEIEDIIVEKQDAYSTFCERYK